MIKCEKELQEKIASCTADLDAKFKGTNGKRSIIVCGGTGCLSSDSAAIIEEFEKQIKERGLEDKVSVNKVGCFGFCSQGPFVKIYPEDTLYRLVQVEDVAEIFEKDILGGEIIERKSKKGHVFFGCGNWPKCNFMSWDAPAGENCPDCGKSLFKKKTGKLVCMTEGCGYEKSASGKKKNNE